MANNITVPKRILSFIMSLLMIFSAFIIFELPTVEAAANLAFDQNNWKGWYECFLNDRSTMDSAGNLTVPTYTSVTGGYLHQQGFNPFSVSGNQIVSSLKQGNRGWDDFVAVASNNYTAPAGYSITVNIQTGMDLAGVTIDSISDSVGYGAFSIAILQSSSLSTTPFTNWLWGAGYGLCGSEGYVVTFTAEANSKSYYDYYNVFKTDSAGNISNPNNASDLLEKKALDGQIVMADGTAPVTLKLTRTAEDTYSIVLSNSNGLTQTLATGLNIDDQDQIYYGVGAFSAGLGSTSANVKPITSSAFVIQSVSDCKGSYLPADFTGNNHKVVGEELTNYYLETCSVCKATIAKRYSITYNANGGSGAPSNTAKAYTCTDPETEATYTVSSTVPTRNGYTFAGWKATSNDSDVNGKIYQKGASIKTGYNLTLTAQWNEVGYNLTLDPAGGTMPSGYSTTYTFKVDQLLSDKIGGFPIPTRTGYTFNGWKLAASGEHWTDGWGTQPYTWGQDITITAQWIANTYTVDFDVNGDTQITFNGQPITVTFGQTYGTLPSISRVGYTFNGWYTAASGGTNITSSSTVSTASDHTLYAHWTANSYTLTFALDGGTQATGYSTSYTFKQDQKFVDVIGGYPAPLKRGYLFDGWKNLTTGEHWTGGWGTQPYTYGANVTLTAQWVEDPDFKPYYLIFDVNGGNLTSDHELVYGINTGDKYADILGTIPTVERTGYTFAGWYNAKYDYTLEINGAFTVAEDVTVVAQWTPIQSVVTLNLNDSTGTKAECSVSSITVSYGSTYSALPTPTRTGYTFNGWYTAASGGTKITTSTTVSITSAQTLYAHWSANSYTLTFVLQGGTQQSGYAESYTFLADQYFNDVIGGFPIPTREGYNFRYWQWSNRTDHCWTNAWGDNQTYYFGQNITVYARWDAKTFTVTLDKNASDATLSQTSVTVTYGKAYGTLPEPSRGDEYIFDGWYTAASGGTKITADTVVTATSNHILYAHWLDAATYTITFNSDGYINVQDYRVAKTVRVSSTSLPGGGTTASFRISKNQKYADAVGNTAYYPTHNLWTFVHWEAVYTDSNGAAKSIILSSDNWNTAVFDGASDVTCTAYYICQHSRFSNAISAWDQTTDPDRVIGRCRVCGYDGAYAYRVNFIARFNRGADILLSYGVPQDELFTYENCLYDSTNGFIIDFLDITDSHPKINIKFNPVILAAKDRDRGWAGWNIGKNTTVVSPKNVQYIFDQNNNNNNKHLFLRAAYEDGFNEIIFNAGTGLKGQNVNDAFTNNGVLVDTNHRYGVLPIRTGEAYHDIIDYIPQAKHIGSYSNIFNPIQFSNGDFYPYTMKAWTLYCSIGWTFASSFNGSDDVTRTQSMMNAWNNGSVVNSETCHRATTISTDVQVCPWYFSRPSYGAGTEVQDDGVAQGYLTTFYANNKGASDDYNDAYYDPDENSGGTMYYMYKKSGSSYTCTPIFGYDPNDYDSSYFIFEPSPANYSADFNITVYDSNFSDHVAVIAKEPKRYTYYMGEGDHYVFPTVVADPEGVAYEPYEKENGYEYYTLNSEGKKVYFGNIADPGYNMITDENGNTYYNSLPSNGNKFKLARTANGVPVCNLYTQNATWEGFGYTGTNQLPLGFPGISYYLGGNKALYTPVQPHGNAMTYFLTALDYQDYGTMYGAGIALSYPDGNQYTAMYSSLANIGLPMQACYYTQWDFEVTFNSNYPTGQTHDNEVGYPTSLPAGNTANVKDGNHYVYGFFDSFSDTHGLNNKMFTCEDYVIDGWQLYNQNGDPVWYDHDYDNSTPGEYLIIDTFDKAVDEPKGLSQIESMKFRNDYVVTIYDAYIYARAPGCEFRAVWKRVYDYTLIEDQAGYGADTFAKVKYKDKFEVDQTAFVTETTTFRVYPDSKITVSAISAASDYTYCFLTLNVENTPTLAGRLLTNATGYDFTIVSDTTHSAVFRPTSNLGTALIDRSNQLLSAWNKRLYKSYKKDRDGYNYYVDTSKYDVDPAYALTKKGTESYTVTVTGSSFSEINTSYTKYYDEVITLMTNARNFKGWQVNGAIVSYDPIFDYRVTGSATVTALYSGTTEPSVGITTKGANADSREEIYITHAAPEGYKLVETGILISSSSHTFVTDDIGDNAYTKIVSANALTDGAFKLMIPSGTKYYAAYAVYYDKDNKIVKIVSDTKQQ